MPLKYVKALLVCCRKSREANDDKTNMEKTGIMKYKVTDNKETNYSEYYWPL